MANLIGVKEVSIGVDADILDSGHHEGQDQFNAILYKSCVKDRTLLLVVLLSVLLLLLMDEKLT